MGGCCSSCSKMILGKRDEYEEIKEDRNPTAIVPEPEAKPASTSSKKHVEFSDISSANLYSSYSQPSRTGFYSKYDLGDEIGSGSTSKCYYCTRKSDGKKFACKIIDKSHIEANFNSLLDQCAVEIKVLQTVNHPNIIHLEDNYETNEKIYMILELMEGGELFDYVVEKGTLSEEEAAVLVRKVTSAIAKLHAMNIIHRDLKPENLLLTGKGSEAEVKLIDFGLAKIMEDTVAKSFLGTRGYLAPEMLQRHAYDKAIDMWALGVIVFVLLCGCLPFDDDSSKIPSEAAARKKFVLRFPRWASNLSASAKDLLHNLLETDPKSRFTAEQALNHPWVNGKSITPNNYLQSPSIMGERRKELRSPRNNLYGAGRKFGDSESNNGFSNNYYGNKNGGSSSSTAKTGSSKLTPSTIQSQKSTQESAPRKNSF